jgi:hypothetical protein
MRSSQDKRTTSKNLEDKFDRGEDVLDYFDVRRARLIDPQSKDVARKEKLRIQVSAIPIDDPRSFART